VQTGASQDGPQETDVISEFQAICCAQSGERCLTSLELQAVHRALQLKSRLADLCGFRCAR
jgi:hypothetical protein